MKPITKATPLMIVGLLTGGAVLFGLNAFFPVPIETWFATTGMLVFSAGLLFGIVALFRSIAALTNSESRRVVGLQLPLQTILIVVGILAVVVTMVIQVKRSLDKRAQVEVEH